MKLKIKLLLAAFIFVFLGLTIAPTKINAEENEKKYYSFVSTEYIDVKYKLTDYPEYEKYNIKDTDFLNKERVAKIPYRVLNIASGAFSKDLDIDDVKVEYKRSKMDLDGKLSETEDASIELKKDRVSELPTYQVSKDDIEKTLNEVDKDIKGKAELLYKAFNHIMLTQNKKFKINQIEKVIVDYDARYRLMISQHEEFVREQKRLKGALNNLLDLGNYLYKEGFFKVFGNNYFYFKFYLGSVSPYTSSGAHFSELKISEHKLLNPELNEKHDLTNLWQFPTKYAHIRAGYGFYLKDELKEEIQAMNKQYTAQKQASLKEVSNKNKFTLKIALAVGIPLLIIAILTPVIVVSVKKRKQSQN